MSVKNLKYLPELEQAWSRNSEKDTDETYGFLRCLEHGAPSPLIRWHHHDEYELHFITETNGTAFVGDYIGEFKPGNLILTGPNLPHNWISRDLPDEGAPNRDLYLQFSEDPFRKATASIPELRQALPLLERAKHGIEFYGISDFAHRQLINIKNNNGLRSLTDFLILIQKLSEHKQYKLLSKSQLQGSNNDSDAKFSITIDSLIKNYNTNLSMTKIAESIEMDSSQFSRWFKKKSGNKFTDFINLIRINHACHMLSETDEFINKICSQVGFKNVANFNRRFVQLKKITPREYRKQSKSKFVSY